MEARDEQGEIGGGTVSRPPSLPLRRDPKAGSNMRNLDCKENPR
jgi:hypothetical protein